MIKKKNNVSGKEKLLSGYQSYDIENDLSLPICSIKCSNLCVFDHSFLPTGYGRLSAERPFRKPAE